MYKRQVQNGPTKATTFAIDASHRVTFIYTYHYFNGGKLPGTIGLRHADGTVYGPWSAKGAAGQGGVANANWFVLPNVEIKAGSYTVLDSDNATWSHNTQSANAGFAELRGIKTGTVVPPVVSVTDASLIGSWKIVANGFTGIMEISGSLASLRGRIMFDAHGIWEDMLELQIRGNSISFLRAGPQQRYTATIQGNGITGTFNQGGSGSYQWRADRTIGVVTTPVLTTPVGISGRWATSEGQMTLSQTGSTVTGVYAQDNGHITGTFNNNVLDGYWYEDSSGQRCQSPRTNGAGQSTYYWGGIKFQFSNDQFTGRWGYCESNSASPWSGTRMK